MTNQEELESKIIQYARAISYDESNALMVYHSFRYSNRKKAFERTLEFLAETKRGEK
jgi:hypothetical protein